ncbi:hypothetical protein [Acetobacter peroxydans]|uniref:Uncharacterized protein n=1 Tax=Acetobacter peroxydans TaxID=104098 RepID=A0A4Y3TWS6_9PROT|nr:hypothetical protein [Acetobacter peroxydans]NHO17131.1 hypothetical protein [Acetobacter peroxydans]GBR38371.1 hypothetical protein AA13755_2175 [Acetobacter peroxydans NBRC 13755]GBR39502.1 hypothetical protein AA0475_0220 [Acetobacter peroxydans]GEB86253.1 hypothetical protein APE01nite_20500 [Acetobacter peroxydans]
MHKQIAVTPLWKGGASTMPADVLARGQQAALVSVSIASCDRVWSARERLADELVRVCYGSDLPEHNRSALACMMRGVVEEAVPGLPTQHVQRNAPPPPLGDGEWYRHWFAVSRREGGA